MKIIWAFLVIGLIVFLSPSAFAGEGHDAGYEWAEENGISDESSCYDSAGESINNSDSFTEGCIQYVEEQGSDEDE